MSEQPRKFLTVETTVRAELKKVWSDWSRPDAIKSWCHASDDWGVGEVSNDLRANGRFATEMKSLDGKTSFVFGGSYTYIAEHSRIAYTMDDGRKVVVIFEETPEGVRVREEFEPEHENSYELQVNGWQAILENFKKYVEGE